MQLLQKRDEMVYNEERERYRLELKSHIIFATKGL